MIEAVKNNGYATITENVYYASKELQKEILELLELKSVIPDGFIKENAG